MALYAGVDLGATNLRAAVADADGAPIAIERRSTPDASGEAVTGAVLDALSAALAAAGVDPAAVEAAGVASIGPLDIDAGAAVGPPNLGVGRIELRDPVADRLGCPVALYNDAVAGAIGERFHADPEPDHLVYLTLSSGVGAGAIVDGRPLIGRGGNAAEVGHFVVDPGGLRCGCGGAGHWEAYCGGVNLPRHARHLQGEAPVETALDLAGEFTAADVFADPEDPLAARVIDAVERWNAVGVADLVHAYAPEVVAVGGAVALNNPALVIEPLAERVEGLLAVEAPDIRAAALGEDAVLLGAVAGAIGAGATAP